jgi:phage shock protein E
MRTGVAAALLAAALLMGGCADGTVSTTSGPTAVTAPTSGSSLSPAEFAAAAKVSGTTIIDVRTSAEFAAGHLAGAVNIDVQAATFAQKIAALDHSKNYAVYCHSGNRSQAAKASMQRAGFAHVFDLAGGIQAWQSAGGDVVTG